MLRAVAVDDEPMALEVIKKLSSKIPFIELLAVFTNAFEAIDYMKKEKIDLIFLDVKMPDISGIDFLKSLTCAPMAIFTTAYSEHAVQSFELDAIDYLLKPFSQTRFLKACNKAYEQYELRENKNEFPSRLTSIFIKDGHEQIRVELNDILYAESSGNYVQFILDNKKIASRLTMNEAQTLLPAISFLRVHRSYIVAKKKITKIASTSVWIKHIEIPIGAAYAASLEKFMGLK